MFGVKVGLRTIKTGISVFFCILVSIILHRETYVVSAITAVFTVREDINRSLSYGKHRIMGNTVGALAALGVMLFFNHFGQSKLVELFLIPLVIMGIIVFLVNFDGYEGIVGATATFLTIVFMIPDNVSNQYALNRVIDSFIGMGIATGVNYFFPLRNWGNANVDTEEVE
ncbi:uncharacterized membrane protein YgaE (UPF0421/DUF939 family) [Enterococcus sp. PF1-24]|uniref:FUSC family protein n=1 Tax=unclassified Enterococcus TaxID=2608891 RepID=UPI0024770215|nr:MULTISPECIES: aromatic acid exporter family protein [unclassified Enterococcus]MDH6363799.1 uncharacterized membrane protein YgaE (UPF0421/DUF939 family) [Enterococcus sp. PFB1-1]MDH6400755.1 uncharacterized membrane protein YgaE (UPF0421/DUF939 family) [Enterococcus sp. PF1-24]